MKIDAQKIEVLMAERDMTKRSMAEICGLIPQNISAIMRRGTCEPRTAGKLARALEVPVKDIIMEEE